VAGILLVSPAGAHVGDTIAHIWGAPGHIKDKVEAFSDARYMRYGWNAYLPPGKTLTGTILSRIEGNGYLLDDGSYQVPLNFDPTVVLVDNDSGTPQPPGCPGTFGSPKANPGYLCIYAGFISDGDTSWDGTWDPRNGSSCGCRRGFVVYEANGSGTYLEGAGSWAVTAPTGAGRVGASTPSTHGSGTGA
jgi:hypothetical protein